MRVDIGLWISGLLFVGASAVSGYDYVKRIEGPVGLSGASNLISISGLPIAVNCKKYFSKGTTGRLLAEPNVQYSYSINGVTLQSDRYSRMRKYETTTPEECDDFAKEFLKNRSVTVWIDPKNPSYAVLNPKLPFPWIEAFTALIGLLALFSAGYLQFARKRELST